MSGLPREISEWLPPDLSEREIAAWALISRSFDRSTGEAMVLRMRDGARRVLTRPERFELFREVPLRDDDPPWIRTSEADPVLVVRVVDGRKLELPLLGSELPVVRGVIETDVVVPRTPRPPRPTSSAPPPRRTSSKPPRGASSTLRPPESAEMEVVRIPRSVRPAPTDALGSRVVVPGSPAAPEPGLAQSPRPARPVAPAVSEAPTPIRESVHPPEFEADPVPIVRGARDIDALRANLKHHWQLGALDEASQVARVLAHLGVADAMEMRLAQTTPEIAPPFEQPLSSYLFKAWLAHDDESGSIGPILEALWPAVLAMRARPERELGLRLRDEEDLERPQHEVGKQFAHAARALSVDPVPRLFVRTDVAGGMAHLVTQPLASLCGGTLATGFDAGSIRHVVAHHLSLYRPTVYLLALVPAPIDSAALFLAGLHLEERIAPDPRLAPIANALGRHMVPQVREALRNATGDLSDSPELRIEATEAFHRFRKAAHLTAVRAGYLLSGSLSVSERMQRMMPAQPGLSVDEVVDDLVSFAVSPAWMALRKEIGIAAEPSAPGALLP